MSSSPVSRASTVTALVLAVCCASLAHGATAGRGRTVKVTEIVQGVEVRKAPADWEECQLGMELTEGHEVSCDPDGQVVLAFGDNSTVVVQPMTQMKIGSFFTKGGVVQTEILLKVGELAAKVNKSDTIRSDFKVRSPTATASVRGTEMESIKFDPVRGMQVAMISGTLDLTSREVGGSTRLTGQDTGRAEQGGHLQDPQSFRRENQGSNASPPGLSRDENRQFRGRFEPPIGPPVGGGSGGDPGMFGGMASMGVIHDQPPPGGGTSSGSPPAGPPPSLPFDANFNTDPLGAPTQFGFVQHGTVDMISNLGGIHAPTLPMPSPPSIPPPGGDGTNFLVIDTAAMALGAGSAVAAFTVDAPTKIKVEFNYNFVTYDPMPGMNPASIFNVTVRDVGSVTQDVNINVVDTRAPPPFLNPVTTMAGSNPLAQAGTALQTGSQLFTHITAGPVAAGAKDLQLTVIGGTADRAGVLIDNVKVTAVP